MVFRVRRTSLVALFGVAVSALMLAWAVSRVDMSGLRNSLHKVDLVWIVAGGMAYLVGFLPRGLRWQIMLRPLKRVGYRTSTQLVVLGYVANNLLPSRLGELVRGVAMSRDQQISAPAVFTTIAVERIFDGLCLLAAMEVPLLFRDFSGRHQREIDQLAVWASGIFVGALACVFAAAYFGDRILIVSQRYLRGEGITRRVLEMAERILQAISFVRQFRLLGTCAALSVLVWLIEGMMFLFVLRAVDLGWDPLLAYFCLGFVNLGALLPSAPGYIGVFHGMTVIAFELFGLPPTEAFAYGTLVHATQYLPITLAGVLFLCYSPVARSRMKLPASVR